MLQAGGLIRLHYHDNIEVLDKFTDINGILFYRGSPFSSNISISQREHNYLTALEDGLFVDGSFIDRFTYDSENDELLFDGIIISRDYDDQSVKDEINSLWNQNPLELITMSKTNTTTLVRNPWANTQDDSEKPNEEEQNEENSGDE